jgi:drug/metabolite transporter (DMT)-like permease
MSAPAARARTAGTAMILASAVVWPFMDAVAKHLAAAGWPTPQIAWGRYAANVLLLAPLVAARHGGRALLPSPRPLHLLRALLPVAGLGGWRPPDASFAAWLVIMAVFGGLALWFITAGYERAEASFLAPFHYVELGVATVIGVAIFGEVPDALAGAGIALIVAAGLRVALRRE